jgi:hypothetical protein
MATESKWPNCCPFCGTHVNRGGAGSRHGTFHCSNCFADYSVEFLGTYPNSDRAVFDDKYRRFLDSQPDGINALRRALNSLDS